MPNLNAFLRSLMLNLEQSLYNFIIWYDKELLVLEDALTASHLLVNSKLDKSPLSHPVVVGIELKVE